jgi:hypothetical protein
MESWKSGSRMTKIIDLRHWAHRRDIIPRCRDRTFSALEGSVPMKTHRCEFWFLIKRPRNHFDRDLPRPWGQGAVSFPKQDALG